MRRKLLEDIYEKTITQTMPSVEIGADQIKELKKTLREMRKGKSATLNEIRSA